MQQLFSHDAKIMPWCNIGFILCDCSFTHHQCLSKGLKKLKRNQAVKFKF